MKSDSIDHDQCDCSCHSNDSIKHCIPCCKKCDICGKNIKLHHYNLHINNCNEKNIDFIKSFLNIRG